MSEGISLNKKDITKSSVIGIKFNSNILNGLYEIKEVCSNRPTTAAENTIGKPPKNPKKKFDINEAISAEILSKLKNKKRLTMSNAIILSKETELKHKIQTPAIKSRKPIISPIAQRPVTYNPTTMLSNQKKLNPRAMSLTRKTEEELINESLPEYSIKKILGKGAYATVRLATHSESGKKVAIKTYEKYQIIEPQKKANMLREIEILKKLDHPHIVKLFETIDSSKFFHLILEYVPGTSLYMYLKSKPNHLLEELEAKRIFRQVLSALDYIHSQNIAHRDIKLDNILLDAKNNVKIIDFGFSTMNSHDEKTRVFCGTPSYMAPEIVGRKDYYGLQADIWALGILLYAMLCGKMPFKAYNDKELYRRIEKGIFTLPNNFSESLKQVINKTLEVNPRKRPTIKDLIEDEWVSSSGILRSTTQNFVLKTIETAASLDLDVISGIVRII